MFLGKFGEVILPVADLDAAIAQYEALGFSVVGQDTWGHALMQRADLRVGLASSPNFPRSCLCFEVDDVAAEMEQLRRAGFAPDGEIASTPTGERGVHMLDANGNDLFIWQTPLPVELENE